MRRIPPLPELLAFEAVARHRSFTRAAAELNVTQSAVSHRIRRLEGHLKAQLLRRSKSGVLLTDAGAALLPELATVLDRLAQLGTERASAEHRLRVTAGTALCTWWLAGRLTRFTAAHPGISIELVPIDNDTSSIPEADVRVLWVGDGHDDAGPTQTPLFSEHVFPVCSPALLPSGRPLRDVRALSNLPLLHKAAHGAGEWSWSVWLERLDIERSARAHRGELRFSDISVALSAAIDGAGVALGRSLLVHDALRDGRLVVPVTGIEPMISSKKHVARWRRGAVNDADVKAFVAWLVDEARATLAETSNWLSSDRIARMRIDPQDEQPAKDQDRGP